jgi:hypothetical protein
MLKKDPMKPSESGALSLGVALITAKSSLSEKGRSR